jgi:hypothetical protein
MLNNVLVISIVRLRLGKSIVIFLNDLMLWSNGVMLSLIPRLSTIQISLNRLQFASFLSP